MLAVVRRLFAISVIQALAGAVTGVIVARSLGPTGRGELATLAAPLGLAPFVLAFGLTTFATRGVAEGRSVAAMVGTLGGASVLIGLVAIPPGLILAHALAEGRHHLEVLIGAGMLTLPISQAGGLLAAVAMGQEDWARIERQRLVPIFVSLVGYVGLFALGRLTVVSAGIVLLVGGFLTVLPVLGVLRTAWPPRLSLPIARDGFAFGARATPITASQLLNHRLDQIVMVPLVSARELGIYAVAVTVSGVTSMFASALSTVLFPRFAAQGAEADVGAAVRKGLLAVTLIIVPTAVVAYPAVPLLFGHAFDRAFPVIVVLLVASVPLSGVSFFASAYAARNRVGTAGVSELIALVITVVGLLLLLRPLGAMGAAIVSLVAYSANFAWLAGLSPRYFGGRVRDYCVPGRAEFAELRARLHAGLATLRARRNGPVRDPGPWEDPAGVRPRRRRT